jgi:hypothetical protein
VYHIFTALLWLALPLTATGRYELEESNDGGSNFLDRDEHVLAFCATAWWLRATSVTCA